LIKINVVGLQSLEQRFHLPHDPRFVQPLSCPEISDPTLVAMIILSRFFIMPSPY
jgi:hypothetical protein